MKILLRYMIQYRIRVIGWLLIAISILAIVDTIVAVKILDYSYDIGAYALVSLITSISSVIGVILLSSVKKI